MALTKITHVVVKMSQKIAIAESVLVPLAAQPHYFHQTALVRCLFMPNAKPVRIEMKAYNEKQALFVVDGFANYDHESSRARTFHSYDLYYNAFDSKSQLLMATIGFNQRRMEKVAMDMSLFLDSDFYNNILVV